jgi:hypothetical protein
MTAMAPRTRNDGNERLKAVGSSVKAVARALRVSDVTVYKALKGLSRSAAMRRLIAEAAGCVVLDLWDDLGDELPCEAMGNSVIARREAMGQGRRVAMADTTAMRTCLKCDRAFRSTGPGNRICGECRSENERLRPVATHRNMRRLVRAADRGD